MRRPVWRWPLVALGVVVSAGVALQVSRWLGSTAAPSDRPTFASGAAPSTPSPEGLAAEQRYRQAVQGIFNQWDRQSGAKVDFARLQDELLKLTVPGRYRMVHLDLAIVLNLLRQGQASGDQASVEEGLTRLDEILKAQPWIGGVTPSAGEREPAGDATH